MSIPWVTITVPARAPAARDFYCPVCGRHIYGEHGRMECPHLVLAYIEETGAFDFCPPVIDPAKVSSDINAAEKPPIEVLAEGLEGESVFLMRIEARSDVSGPATTIIGIDMNPPSEEIG